MLESECCGAEIKWHDICCECGEHCEAIEDSDDQQEILDKEQFDIIRSEAMNKAYNEGLASQDLINSLITDLKFFLEFIEIDQYDFDQVSRVLWFMENDLHIYTSEVIEGLETLSSIMDNMTKRDVTNRQPFIYEGRRLTWSCTYADLYVYKDSEDVRYFFNKDGKLGLKG